MRLFVVLVLSLLAVVSATAGQLSVTVPLDPSAINVENAGIYARVTGIGMNLMETVGNPAMPKFTARVALPTGTSATSIEVTNATYTPLRGRFSIIPAAQAQPLSVERELKPVEPNPEIYGSSEFFPALPVRLASSSVIMGIPVAYLEVYPARWNPASGTVEVLTDLTVKVHYENDPSMLTVKRRSLQSERRSQKIVSNVVVNPEDVSPSGATIVDSKSLKYGEYVIITPSEYENYAKELAEWKSSKGVPTNVYTTSWVQSQYSFVDLQQEIRAFLTDCRDEGVEYVLIYGDDDKIAGRDVRIHYSSYTEYPPVDMYWADINDSKPGDDLWNSNGNNTWGEYGVDSLDYHPDLWVGRASVNSKSECTIFNDKVFAYEQVNLTDYFDTAPIELRIGYTTELLWPECYGSAGAELISKYVPSGWEEEKCYDSNSNNSVTITNDMLNAGPHHVYHASHGNPTAFSLPGGTYNTSHFMNLTNISDGNLPAIWNSISCLIGRTDGYECMADAWNNSPKGGGFGCFNARYGWGTPSNPGYGESEILCRHFYDVMWNDTLYNLGVAHLMASDAMVPPSELADWCIKEYNLFGDPELPMWFLEADSLEASHPSSISGSGNIDVTVTSGGSPVEGARVCIKKGHWQTGEVYDVDTTNSSGKVTLYADPSTTGSMSIVAWARDHISYLGTINVTSVGMEGDVPGFLVNSLGAAYPSPAKASVTIPFSVARSGNVSIDIYDVTGRIVTTLDSGEMAAGRHAIEWNLKDTAGAPVPSGMYHVRVTSGDWTDSTSLVVIR